MLVEGLSATEAAVANKAGDAKAAIAGAAKVIEATYSYPFQNHACMEPMYATALYTASKCEVWCPTQNGEAALAAAAAASGLPVGQCDVYKLPLGGGFGRRGAVHDFVTQAVTIAKEMPGVPVKLLWTREEDMLHGRYHPITKAKLVGGLDANGKLVGLHMRLSGQSILAGLAPQNMQGGVDRVAFQGLAPDGDAAFGYTIPNLLIDYAMRNPHVPPGFWRGVNANHNAIYIECFIDELAKAAGKDPLAFRREIMAGNPKNLAVLNAVAEKVGWDKPPAPGIYRGLSQIMAFGSYTAACAEVSVTKGKVKVHRIVAGSDSGYVVNPQQVEAQIEGSFVYGLSAMLYGECTVKGGRIEQENFDTYNVLRMDEMPKVESVLVPSGGFWGGVGEPTIAVAAPAVLNAIAAATGKRVRSFPLKNQSLA